MSSSPRRRPPPPSCLFIIGNVPSFHRRRRGGGGPYVYERGDLSFLCFSRSVEGIGGLHLLSVLHPISTHPIRGKNDGYKKAPQQKSAKKSPERTACVTRARWQRACWQVGPLTSASNLISGVMRNFLDHLLEPCGERPLRERRRSYHRIRTFKEKKPGRHETGHLRFCQKEIPLPF